MIEYIEGRIDALNPTDVVVDCGGVGYIAEISLNTFTGLQGREKARIFIHEVIREDAHLLFGFLTVRERKLFRLLCGVNGVGANTARMMLSALAPQSLEMAIAGGDVATLKSIKGIGAKTAERIVVDLRDKIKPETDALIYVTPAASEAFDEALAALVMLGFQKQASQKILKKIFERDASIRAEAAIKAALSMM